MRANPLRDTLRVRMTERERERYVRWWIEQSGLSPRSLRLIATGIWADYIPVPEPASDENPAGP